MSFCVLAVGVVRVVGRDKRRTDAPRYPDQSGIGPALLDEPVILQLYEEVPPTEHVLEARASRWPRLVARKQRLEDHSAETSGRGDHPFVVALEQLPVHRGL